MESVPYPLLQLDDWRDTRDILWGYVRVFSAVRRRYSDRHAFWWHVTLYVTPRGLTTGRIPIDRDGPTVELCLDLMHQRAEIQTSAGATRSWPLAGQTPGEFMRQTTEAIAEYGLTKDVEWPEPPTECHGGWDAEAVLRFGSALRRIDNVFDRFRDGLDGQCSPVHLFGHHFDLSLVWLSGRTIDGTDPDDPEMSSEQMTFGFSTGDDTIPEPYFYATAYPEPAGFSDSALPEPAYWHDEGFSGAVLLYGEARRIQDPDRVISGFLVGAHTAGAMRMRDDA